MHHGPRRRLGGEGGATHANLSSRPTGYNSNVCFISTNLILSVVLYSQWFYTMFYENVDIFGTYILFPACNWCTYWLIDDLCIGHEHVQQFKFNFMPFAFWWTVQCPKCHQCVNDLTSFMTEVLLVKLRRIRRSNSWSPKFTITLHLNSKYLCSVHTRIYICVSLDAPASPSVSWHTVIYMLPSTVYQYGGRVQRAYKALRRIFRPRPVLVSCASRARAAPATKIK